MFVIVHDNNVIFGPKNWNKLNFEEVILEDCEVECSLETRNNDNLPIVINDGVKILPVVGLPQPEFNPKIQRLEGPYWNFFDDRAEMYFTVGDIAVDAVKNFMKSWVANERYNSETGSFEHTIGDQTITVGTSREQRNTYVQTYVMMDDTETINWKTNVGWIKINKSDMFGIIQAVKAHVQNCFDWENTKHDEIESADTLNALDSIDHKMS